MPVFSQGGHGGGPTYANRNVFLWSFFPAIARSTGHGNMAGAWYRAELDKWRRKHGLGKTIKHPVTVSRAVRMSLMKEVEKRIVQRDWDDAFLILAV